MSRETRLPQVIAAFIEATNAHQNDEFLTTLSESAVITDEGQEYRGIGAFKEWSDEKYKGHIRCC
jgi:hypothetical protein